MPNVDVTRDHPPLPLAPIDPSVIVPASVKKAAALAESFYSKAAAPPADNEPAPPAPDAASPQPEPVAPAEPPQQAQPAPADADAQPPAEFELGNEEVIVPSRQELSESEWARRYNSMKGRYDTSQRTIGSMQEQMQQLGDELVRTQQMAQNAPPPRPTEPKPTLITPEDEAAYGPELIDLATRAARQAIEPELDALRNQNNELQQRVTTQAKKDMFGLLDAAQPDWRTINKSQRFISWLRLPDVYSRRVRQSLLDAAYQAADAPTVLAFFKGFLDDETATGNAEPAPRSEPPVAPRTAAVPLATLAAPGRARPATGDTPGPADKPIFTRNQIQRFYSDVRRGVYAGNETEKARQENAIFAAQREGRVRG